MHTHCPTFVASKVSLAYRRLILIQFVTLVSIALGVFFCVAQPQAQAQTSGALAGTVADVSGAVIPTASIRVLQKATGMVSTAETNDQGLYRFPVLAPGTYEVIVSKAGFRNVTEEVTIVVTETATFNFSLALETASQTVTISAADAPLLQTESATLGRIVDNRTVQAIPLATRNFTQLLVFSPGTSAQLNDATALGRGTLMSNTGGQRATSNELTIDGVDAVNIHTNTFVENQYSTNGTLIPSPEMVQEFKVQTGLFDAQYGRNAGANISLVTRTGTDHFHGTVFEFLRNDALNANSYFLNRNGVARPEMRQNQFGGTMGGPLPKKTYFFLGYQGTRQINGYSGSATTTIPLALGPDRSAAALGAAFAGEVGVHGGLAIAQDGSNISPTALALLNFKMLDGGYLIPSAQTAQATGNYSVSIPSQYDENQGTVNVLHYFGPNDTFSARGFLSNQPQTNMLGYANVEGFPFTQNFKGRLLSLEDSHVFRGGSLVNDARFGFMRMSGVESLSSQLSIDQFGIERFNSSYRTILPEISVSGSFTLGYNPNADQGGAQNLFQYSDYLTAVRGRHSLRFGGEVRRYQDNFYVDLATFGTISIQSFPDFLLGRAGGDVASGGNGTSYSNLNASTVASNLGNRNDRLTDYALFFQDDWKASPRLALNLGLRWERFGSGVDLGGRDGNFIPSLYVAPPAGGFSSAGFVQSSNAKPLLPGIPTINPRLLNHELWKNFAPRLGFSYRLSNPLVLRGGYGIFYDRLSNQIGLRSASTPPSYIASSNSGAANIASTLGNPYPSLPLLSQLPVAPRLYAPPYSASRQALSTNAVDPNLTSPYVHQYGLNVQWQTTSSLLLEVGYVGNTAMHMPTQSLNNQAFLASPSNPINGVTTNIAANAINRVPFLGMSPTGLASLFTKAAANYNALEVSATNRPFHGLQFLASYTFSKSLSNYTGGTQALFSSSSGDQWDLGQAYGPSDYNHPHRFIVNYVYEVPYWGFGLPASKVSRTLFADWSLSGVTTWQSGSPFTITDANGGSLYGSNTSRASFASGATARTAEKSGSPESRLQAYFNPSAFVSAGGYFGNTSENLLMGPHQADWDLSAAKRFPIKEKVYVEWRSEFFNLFNHPSFGNPASEISSPTTFGSVTSTIGNPRLIQFAAKVVF